MQKENPQAKHTAENGNDLMADGGNIPSFGDWVNKYFEAPKMKMMYKLKDGKGEYDKAELLKRYKRAMGL